MARIFRQQYVGGRTGRNWIAEFRDADNILRRRTTGCRDKAAAQQLAAEYEREAERQRAGLTPRNVTHLQRPLTEHIAEYESHLRSKGVSEQHRSETMRRLRKLVNDCGFTRLTDIQPTPVDRWLNLLVERGSGPRTRNTYLASLRAFIGWTVKTNRLPTDALEVLELADESADVRIKRRAMADAEILRLLVVARLRPLAERSRAKRRGDASKLTWDTLTALAERTRDRLRLRPAALAKLERLGRERELIYKALVLTGLRRGELESLTWDALDLESDPPTLLVNAADAKGGHTDVLPLRDHLAAELRAWLSECGKPAPTERVFNVPDRLVEILKRDLATAGIRFVDDAGRRLDVHAMRHTTATHLARAGVAPRTAQRFLRHSCIDLTMQVYTDPRLLDMTAALDALPDLSPVSTAPMQQRATGTDGKAADGTGDDTTPAEISPARPEPVEKMWCPVWWRNWHSRIAAHRSARGILPTTCPLVAPKCTYWGVGESVTKPARMLIELTSWGSSGNRLA